MIINWLFILSDLFYWDRLNYMISREIVNLFVKWTLHYMRVNTIK